MNAPLRGLAERVQGRPVVERDYSWPESAGEYGPWSIEGQQVSWCANPEWKQRMFVYVARVVTPGSYRWEPALIQSEEAPEVGFATNQFVFTIE